MGSIDLSSFVFPIVLGSITGLLAFRKSRNGILWTIIIAAIWAGGLLISDLGRFAPTGDIDIALNGIGPIAWVLGTVLLAFLPYLCPKCRKTLKKKLSKLGVCPHCGESVLKDQPVTNYICIRCGPSISQEDLSHITDMTCPQCGGELHLTKGA